MVNSRSKGARGEREVAHLLEQLGLSAHRGRQYHGGPGVPDIKTSIPGVHFEVKRYKSLGLTSRAYKQASDDMKGEDLPAVLLREDRGKWLVAFALEDIHAFIERFQSGITGDT